MVKKTGSLDPRDLLFTLGLIFLAGGVALFDVRYALIILGVLLLAASSLAIWRARS